MSEAERGPTLDVDAILAPERLTELLARSGRLAKGARVAAVVREGGRPTLISQVERARLEYAGDRASAPASLFLKTTRGDIAPDIASWARNEAAFYRDVAPFSPDDVLAHCVDASTGSETESCYVLLEDLSATHAAPIESWPVPLAMTACEELIDAYARFHAAWWDNARLGVSVGRWLDESTVPNFLADVRQRWTTFRNLLGDRLSDERASRYEKLLAALPRLLDRLRTHRHLTIAHGDAHVWNALYPTVPGATVRIIDWDAWRVDVGVRDLAYMIALHWYPERRRRFERPLLRRYHDGLVAHGVAGYTWDALLDDYRRAALLQLMRPVFQATMNIPAPVWWGHLERGMLAFEDLDCAALLD